MHRMHIYIKCRSIQGSRYVCKFKVLRDVDILQDDTVEAHNCSPRLESAYAGVGVSTLRGLHVISCCGTLLPIYCCMQISLYMCAWVMKARRLLRIQKL